MKKKRTTSAALCVGLIRLNYHALYLAYHTCNIHHRSVNKDYTEVTWIECVWFWTKYTFFTLSRTKYFKLPEVKE